MSSSLKRTSLSFEDYKTRRDENFENLNNNQARTVMLQKDLRRIINYDHKDGKTYFNNQIHKVNQDATAAGRNISDSVDPKIYQKLNDVIEDQNVDIDVRKRIVEEVYKIRENLQLNQKLYSNLNSFLNALTSNSEINKDGLDENFQANLNFLYGISDEISKIKDLKTLDETKLNEIFENSTRAALKKSNLNLEINPSKSYETFEKLNKDINDEFNLQNSAYRNKDDLLKDLSPETKKDLKLMQKFNQEIGELEANNSKLEKIKDKRIPEILNRVDEIQKEKNDLKNQINSLKGGDKDSSQKKAKEDLQKQYEEKIKSSEKELDTLKKEAKKIYKLATGEKALRDPESKKDKIAITDKTKDANQTKDANYIKDLLNKSKGENNKLNTKIEENKKTIDNNKNKTQNLTPIKEKLEENADLLKQKDSLKLKLAEKRSEKSLTENLKSSKIGKAIGFETEGKKERAEIKTKIDDIDSKIKENNKEIKDRLKEIQITDRTEFKQNTKELHKKNKESSKDLKFQERNSLNKGGAIKQVVNKIDKASLKTHNDINLYKNKADKGLKTDEQAASKLETKTNIKKAAQYVGLATAATPVVATTAPVAAVGATGYGAYKLAKNAPEIAAKAGEEIKAAAGAVASGARTAAGAVASGAGTAKEAAVSAAKTVGEGLRGAYDSARDKVGSGLQTFGSELRKGVDKSNNQASQEGERSHVESLNKKRESEQADRGTQRF